MDWPRAGRFIRAARARRGYPTAAAFAHALGVSETTVRDLELGRRGNFKDTTLARVEAELGWPDHLIEQLAGGAQFPPHLDPDLHLLTELWQRLSPRDRAVLVQLARQLTRP